MRPHGTRTRIRERRAWKSNGSLGNRIRIGRSLFLTIQRSGKDVSYFACLAVCCRPSPIMRKKSDAEPEAIFKHTRHGVRRYSRDVKRWFTAGLSEDHRRKTGIL
ncbi:hypothetical protein DPMN_015282 [Dreissena polymorpha]|uniref:Uncharacterized protein n=1 Tax=Dreissena polymorpha TaxID=45954 RepID=A0A9D4NDC4_DREPO|nr:hypothetical protein DPMN_015282 [Dreissena polymorpha]